MNCNLRVSSGGPIGIGYHRRARDRGGRLAGKIFNFNFSLEQPLIREVSRTAYFHSPPWEKQVKPKVRELDSSILAVPLLKLWG
jgi:hypothetical protein